MRLPAGPFRGLSYRADRLPYARLLLPWLGKFRVTCVTGPVQGGKSLHGYVLPIVKSLFADGEDVICGLPNIKQAVVKWKQDIEPIIKASSYAHLLPDTGGGSKGGIPDLLRFKNGRSLLFMAGGGNDEQRASATTRILAVTEVDKLDVVSESSKEGQNKIDQLIARTKAYGDRARIFLECTVSTEDAMTWRTYQAGTASVIVCPCVHCGQLVTPEREHFIGWQEAGTAIEAGQLARFTCPECGGHYDEEQRREMNLAAQLVHRGQEVTADGKIVGTMIETDTFSFRWSAFNNLLMPARLIGVEEWEAAHCGDLQAEEKQIALLQQTWCLPAKNTTVERQELTEGVVRGTAIGFSGRCTGLVRGDIPPNPECVTAAIDISRRLLQWQVVAHLADSIHVVDYGFHQTAAPDVVGDETAITDALRELTTELADRFPLQVGLIDCGNWRETIIGWTRLNHHGLWRPSHGLPLYKHPESAPGSIVASACGAPWHLKLQGGVWVVNFNPDAFKRSLHSAYEVRPLNEEGQPQRGRVSLFGDNPMEHREFARQVTAEVWKTTFNKDRSSRSAIQQGYVKIRRDNHMLDTGAMNLVAVSVAATLKRRQGVAPRQFGKLSSKKGELYE